MWLLRTLPLAVALALTGCGGSGGSNDNGTATPAPPPPPSYKLAGAAVKGPWQNASFSLFELDKTATDLKGKVLASGRSGTDARFENLTVTAPIAEYYVLEAKTDELTTELTNGAKPYSSIMRTIISRAQLEANSTVYVTPISTVLTTLVSSELAINPQTAVTTALSNAKDKIIATVGFNLSASDDLLRASALLRSSATVETDFRFRQANEALAVSLFHLISGTNVSFDDALHALALDISDGSIDAKQHLQPIATLSAIPDFLAKWQTMAVRHLTIPGTAALASGADIRLEQLPQLLHHEAQQLNQPVELSSLTSAAARYIIASFGADLDNDGYPDSVDNDIDGDGYANDVDAFPMSKAEWLDTDGDGIGNNTDPDDDNDSVADSTDAFPLDASEWLDTDGDGIGNNTDPDDDNDGVVDAEDAFALDAAEWLDTDGDGIGNNADSDDDNDGVTDTNDLFPLDAAEFADYDGDGIGDNADLDDDNDGTPDTEDMFPYDATESADYDSDGIGDNSDPDRDNDGITDTEDNELYSTIYRDQIITLNSAYLQSIAPAGVNITEQSNRITISGGSIHLPPTAENAWYVLQKHLQIGLDTAAVNSTASATLRVSPGTTVTVKNPEDTIIVSRGSSLIAVGYQQSPVTFTSDEDVNSLDTVAAQWGGIMLLGKAFSNQCSANAPCEIPASTPFNDNYYGGTEQNDSSGQLRYVRIKYAGGAKLWSSIGDPALALYGVGAGTVLSHIHIDTVAGDGLALTGGTAQIKHLIVTNAGDDSLDWADGYTGKMQYVLLRHAEDDSVANRAIEADNANNTPAATPISRPNIANLTIIGNNYDGDDDSEGVLLRYGSQAYITNTIITGSTGMGECLEIDSSSTAAANAGLTQITHSIMACENGENFKPVAGFDIEQWFLSLPGNAVMASRDAVIDGIYTITDHTPLNMATQDGFFSTTGFVGAVSKEYDWTANWSLLIP